VLTLLIFFELVSNEVKTVLLAGELLLNVERTDQYAAESALNGFRAFVEHPFVADEFFALAKELVLQLNCHFFLAWGKTGRRVYLLQKIQVYSEL
jgi:hypothetical protein